MSAIARPAILRPGWIMYGLFVLNPVIWALGFGGFIWSLASIPLAGWALLRRNLERPPAVAIYILYVIWVGFSIIMVDRFTRVLAFGLRYGVYLTALGLAYYVYNERRVRRTTFINWVALLWVWAIIGGYLGLLLPRFRLNVTLASTILPGSLLQNEFVTNLVRPRFAQVQNIFGVAIPRPATLWAFTNDWGGNVAVLTPFFIAATLYSLDPRMRRVGAVALALAAPVMILSVNRGLWLSCGAIAVVLAVRSFLAGRSAPLKVLAALAVLIAALVVLTPVGGVVTGRLSESSADSREGIYQEAWEGALQSPILGWGGPRPSSNPFSPSVGTHGHVWFAMFSHGLVGLALYVAWMVVALYKANARRDPVSIMLGCVLWVGALEMFFYDMFAGPLPIVMVAVGLLGRSDDRLLAERLPSRHSVTAEVGR